MLVFPLSSRRNIIKFLGLHPHTHTHTHTSCASPGMARRQRWHTNTQTHTHTHTQRKEHNSERCVQSTSQSHFMLRCCLITMKPDHAAVSHCNQTWANWPRYTAAHIVFPLWQLFTIYWIKQCYGHHGNHSSVCLLCHRKSFSEPVEECNKLWSRYWPVSLGRSLVTPGDLFFDLFLFYCQTKTRTINLILHTLLLYSQLLNCLFSP